MSHNFHDWKLDNYIVGFTCIPPYTSSGGAQLLYVPSIMPQISIGRGRPKSQRAPLNKSCFINDDKCKPAVSNQTTIQNYITVSPADNQGFSAPVFYDGSRIPIEVTNGDPDKLTLSTKEDTSSYPPP